MEQREVDRVERGESRGVRRREVQRQAERNGEERGGEVETDLTVCMLTTVIIHATGQG